MLQELHLEIRDKKGTENVVADHLSRLENLKPEHVPMNDNFSYDRLVVSLDIERMSYDHYHEYLKAKYSNVEDEIEEWVALVYKIVPWYADYVNYLAAKVLPPDMTYQHKKKFFHDLKHFYWDEPLIFKRRADGLSVLPFLRRKLKTL